MMPSGVFTMLVLVSGFSAQLSGQLALTGSVNLTPLSCTRLLALKNLAQVPVQVLSRFAHSPKAFLEKLIMGIFNPLRRTRTNAQSMRKKR
jgi:hypothetical protein